MATDIIARGMITEYKSGANINFAENEDGSVTISASGSISSEDSVARDTINNHKSDTSNPHNVTPAQIGLGNVDNTSDLDKPISTAVQKAIDSKADKTVATTSADGLMSAEDKGKLDDADNTYALKSKYGDTTIDVGRKADTKKGSHSTAEGYNATASGECSHAEGHSTTTSGNYSHAEGRSTTASGVDSHAEGQGTTASGADSHAEGVITTASGECSHAEGKNTTASGLASHAGGTGTKALHDNEVAYGKYNESKDDTVFSVGDGTSDSARHNAFEITTTGGKLHDKDIATADLIPTELPANGGNADTVNGHTVDANVPADAVFTDTVPDLTLYALKSKYGDTTINVGRKAGTTVGVNSTAEGTNTTSSSHSTHAEGIRTTASGGRAHAEGMSTTASGNDSHAEGCETTASGHQSHAEGYVTTASKDCSHAEGMGTTASASNSHAEGYYTTATNYASHVSGKLNASMTTGGGFSNTTGTAFVIGNGTGNNALSNAFSVQYDGTVKAKSTITASTTADYAEFFEWLDENPDGEDRVGYFVTLDGDKIKIANPDDEYILGIVSGEPFVLGNGDCDTWNGMFLHDEFRRTIYEPAPKIEEILDDDGNPTGEFKEIEGAYEGTRPKLNPEYDYTQKYISRFDRKEWAPVGMLGVLAVRHDGTARVNGYVTVNSDGIATACEKNNTNAYRVIKSNSESVVEVIFK